MSRNTTPALITQSHDFPSVNLDGQSSAHFGDVYHLLHIDMNQEQQSELNRNEILTALAFEAMNARHMQLAQISVESLEWIWLEKENNGPGFIEWLMSEATTFWITGKPASGKSTLMNFLATSHSCENILQRHSGHTWLLLDFYFDFRAGSQTPNSLVGLLRSFLFQLVKKNSTAAKIVQDDTLGCDIHVKHNDLDLNTLFRLIEAAIKAISNTHRVFALVDGLDEYSGNYVHLIRMTERLVLSGIDKVCLASRPENLLHQFLVCRPHFRMQDYNYKTIQAYITHAVEQATKAVKMPMDKEALINEVVHSSDGVILWTRLATETLLESLLGGDTAEEIRAKLREFPTELNEAYERLLSTLKSPQRLETALMLHLIRTASHPLPPRDLHCMLVFLRDTGRLPSWPRQPIDDTTFLLRLRARTSSMVDIVQTYYPPYQTRTRHDHSSRVSLFHKTLHDYLTASGWIDDILSTASVVVPSERLWLQSFAQCLLEYDLPPASLSTIWDSFRPRDPEHYHSVSSSEVTLCLPLVDKTTLETAHMISFVDTVGSGMALLDCAIANYPTYLARNAPYTGPEQNLYQRVLGSSIMILHFVMDRLRDEDGFNHACPCWYWCRFQAFYSKESLFTMSFRQRAILFAILHEDLRSACSWLSQEAATLDRISAQEILRALVFNLLRTDREKTGKHEVLSLLRPLAQYANDEIIAPLISNKFLWADSEFPTPCIPYLAVNSGRRKLTKSWVVDGDLISIASEGYNLYLLWTATTQSAYAESYYWTADGSALKRLEAIVASGLDVNEPCCKLGPPLHTAVEVCLISNCRIIGKSRVINQLIALWDRGAYPWVSFEGLTAQELATKRLREIENDTYVPVVQTSDIFNKRAAIENMRSIVRCLEVGLYVGNDMNEERAIRLSHKDDEGSSGS